MSGAWLLGGVQMSTKSTAASARSSFGVAYQRAPGAWAETSACCSGRTSVTATISTSRRRRQPGRCPCRATLPRPMIAPRRMLLEPVISHHHLERLVQDREPRQRRVLFDRERRVDADRRRVGHGDQPAAETFLVERLRRGLRERLLRGPVADQLDTEHQAAPAYLADAAVFLFQRLQTAQHH